MPDETPKGDFGANDLDSRPEIALIFKNIKEKLPDLKKLLDESRGHWGYEDSIYRFYHYSWKVYNIQGDTMQITEALQALNPGEPLNETFLSIVKGGTGRQWTRAANDNWDVETRPILEAFFHAKYFLEMVVKYGEELEYPPNLLPSGWAAVLYLFNLR